MNVLVINCGSSSLKYQLIDTETEEVLAKGLCERIGIDGSKLTHTKAGNEKVTIEAPMPDHKVAVSMVIDALLDKNYGVVDSLDKIDAVGHRVVHGGESFSQATRINDQVMEAIRECNDLAPLHNPANITGIEVCEQLMPGVPMVAVFDTAFHQTMPPKAYLYGLPYEYYEKSKIRTYGFHGTSHAYVSKRAAEILGKDYNNFKVIVCHLGNGASISAVKDGKCIDTSMGLTPLAGVIMGTRSGDIDPAILKFIADKEDLTLSELDSLLNKKSGVLGMSGVSSDFRDLTAARDEGNQRAKDTLDTYSYTVAKYIGSYVAALNGVDAIVFTAGVGENTASVRKTVIDEYFGYLGVSINDEKNALRGEEVIISNEGSKVDVLVVPTNEELAIARDTVALVK